MKVVEALERVVSGVENNAREISLIVDALTEIRERLELLESAEIERRSKPT